MLLRRPNGCREQLHKPTARERYAPKPHCVLEPMAQGANDWRKIKFVRKAGDGGDERHREHQREDGKFHQNSTQVTAATSPRSITSA